MIPINTENVKIVRQYHRYLAEGLGLQKTTIDHRLRALKSFETFTKNRDFKKFKLEDAISYREHLCAEPGGSTQRRAKLATVADKLAPLPQFFTWLAERPGFRSRINRSDLEYFSLPLRDQRVSRQPGRVHFATPEQLMHVLRAMPSATEIEKRNRAIVALFLLTGIRIMALVTLKLKHVMPDGKGIHQDGAEVHTKFAKTFDTYFLPIDDKAREAFMDWVNYLRNELHWGYDDPLFPKTGMAKGVFKAEGLVREPWTDPGAVRRIWQRAFEGAGIKPCTPHSVRRTLVAWSKGRTLNVEQLQAVSENLGHDLIGTTICHYGGMTLERRSEIISAL